MWQAATLILIPLSSFTDFQMTERDGSICTQIPLGAEAFKMFLCDSICIAESWLTGACFQANNVACYVITVVDTEVT